MIEIITRQPQQEQLRTQVLSDFLATLGDDKSFSSKDLYDAGVAFAGGLPELVVGPMLEPAPALTPIIPVIPEVVEENTDVASRNTPVIDLAISRRNKNRRHKLSVKVCAGAMGLIIGTVAAETVPLDEMVHDYRPAVAAESSDAQTNLTVPFSVPSETSVTVPASTAAPETATTVEPDETAVSTTPVAVEGTASVQTEVLTTTISAPETTVPDTAMPATEAPAPLSLTEQFESGATTLDSMKGRPIGSLILTQLCEKVSIYVENPVDFSNPYNVPRLTADAQAKVALLNDPSANLTNDQRLMLGDDISEFGLPASDVTIPGVGSPMFALLQAPEAEPELAGCVPTIESTRDEQVSRGSSLAFMNGMNGVTADQYMPIADLLPEFAALPGGGKVTYIQGHRSTQSAAFKDIHKLENGNTAIYIGDDGKAIDYVVVGKEQIDGDIHLDELAARLNAQAAGQDWLVLQVCIEGNPNNRALVILQKV